MNNVTEKQYAENLLQIIADRGDHYRGASETEYNRGICSYLPDNGTGLIDSPHLSRRASPDRCIHGEAMHRLGVPDYILRTSEEMPVQAPLARFFDFSAGFVFDMFQVQGAQDVGKPYGELRPMIEAAIQRIS